MTGHAEDRRRRPHRKVPPLFSKTETKSSLVFFGKSPPIFRFSEKNGKKKWKKWEIFQKKCPIFDPNFSPIFSQFFEKIAKKSLENHLFSRPPKKSKKHEKMTNFETPDQVPGNPYKNHWKRHFEDRPTWDPQKPPHLDLWTPDLAGPARPRSHGPTHLSDALVSAG